MGIKINAFVIGAIVALALAILFLLYRQFADTPSNNLRKAIKYHKIGQRHYENGNYEEAKLHFEAAKQFREKAFKEKGEK